MSTDYEQRLAKIAADIKRKNRENLPDADVSVTPNDGDSGRFDGEFNENGSAKRFRIRGFNAPEMDYDNGRVDAHPDGERAKETLEELLARGARIKRSSERGAYGRELVDLVDEDGRNLSDELVRSGLASATQGYRSSQAELSMIARKALGRSPTDNEFLKGELEKREGNKNFTPWTEGILPNGTYDRRGTFKKAWDRGSDDAKASLGGLVNWIGDATGIESWTEYGKVMAQKASVDARISKREVADYSKVDNLEEAFTYLVETVGELAPGLIFDVASTAVTGGAGLSQAIIRRAGAAAIKNGVKKGLIAGPALSGFMQATGNMENELESRGSEINTGAAATSGAIGAAVNLAPYAAIANDVLRASGLGDDVVRKVVGAMDDANKNGLGDRISDVLKTAGKAGATEGVTESTQMIIDEIIASTNSDGDWDLTTLELVDGSIRAVLGGGTMGATAGGIANIVGEYSEARKDAKKDNGFEKVEVEEPKTLDFLDDDHEEQEAGDDEKSGVRNLLKGAQNAGQKVGDGIKQASMRFFGAEGARREASNEAPQPEIKTREAVGLFGEKPQTKDDFPDLDSATHEKLKELIEPNGKPASLKEISQLVSSGLDPMMLIRYMADTFSGVELPIYQQEGDKDLIRGQKLNMVIDDTMQRVRDGEITTTSEMGYDLMKARKTGDVKTKENALRAIDKGFWASVNEKKIYDWRRMAQAFITQHPSNRNQPTVDEPSGVDALDVGDDLDLDSFDMDSSEVEPESTETTINRSELLRKAVRYAEEVKGEDAREAKKSLEHLDYLEELDSKIVKVKERMESRPTLTNIKDQQRLESYEKQLNILLEENGADNVGSLRDIFEADLLSDLQELGMEADLSTEMSSIAAQAELDEDGNERTVGEVHQVIEDEGEFDTRDDREIRADYRRRTGRADSFVADLKGMFGTLSDHSTAQFEKFSDYLASPTNQERKAGNLERGTTADRVYKYVPESVKDDPTGNTAKAKTAKVDSHTRTVSPHLAANLKKLIDKGIFGKAEEMLHKFGMVDVRPALDEDPKMTLNDRVEKIIRDSYKKQESYKDNGVNNRSITLRDREKGNNIHFDLSELVSFVIENEMQVDLSGQTDYVKFGDIIHKATFSAIAMAADVRTPTGAFKYNIDLDRIPNDLVVFRSPNDKYKSVTMGSVRSRVARTDYWTTKLKQQGPSNDLLVKQYKERMLMEGKELPRTEDPELIAEHEEEYRDTPAHLVPELPEATDAELLEMLSLDSTLGRGSSYVDNPEFDQVDTSGDVNQGADMVEVSVRADEALIKEKGDIEQPLDTSSAGVTIFESKTITKEDAAKIIEDMEKENKPTPRTKQKAEKLRKVTIRRRKKARNSIFKFVEMTKTRLAKIHPEAERRTTKFNNFRRMFSQRLLSRKAKVFRDAEHIQKGYEDYIAGRKSVEARNYLDMLAEVDSLVKQFDPDFLPEYGKGGAIHLDYKKLVDNSREFEQILKKSKIKDVDKIMEGLLEGDGYLGMTIDIRDVRVNRPSTPNKELSPAFDALKKAGFIDTDAPRHLIRYMYSAATWAAWNKTHGGKTANGGWNSYAAYDKYSKEVNPGDRRDFKKLMNGVTGNIGKDMAPWLRKFNSAAMAFQTATILWFSGVASIPELAAVYARSRGELDGIGSDVKAVLTGKGRAEMMQVAQDFDIIAPEIVEHSLQQLYNMGDLTTGRLSQAVSSTVFKLNGQTALTNITRALGVKAGQRFLERHAKSDSDNSKRMLKELHIDAATVNEFLESGDIDSEAGKKYRDALHLFVDESVTNPTSSQVPLIMNDPRFAIFTTLKKFFYGFYDNVHKSLWNDAKIRRTEGLSTVTPFIITGALLLPLGALSEFIREMIKYPLGRPNGARSFSDFFKDSALATGGLGPLTMAESVYEQTDYGRNPVVTSLGPTVSLAADIVSGDFRPSRAVPIVGQHPWAAKEFNALVKNMVE